MASLASELMLRSRNQSRSAKRIRRLVFLLCLLLVLPIAEIAAGIWLRIHPVLVRPPENDARNTAYAGATYLNNQFFTERELAERANIEGTTFSGKYFNVVNGWRSVPNAPLRASCTLWYFSNSAGFGYEVPDNETIAAELQRLTTCRVENRSLISAANRTLESILSRTPVRPGDIVVFVTGVMEPQLAAGAVHESGIDAPYPARSCFDFFHLRSYSAWKLLCGWLRYRYTSVSAEFQRPYLNDYGPALRDAKSKAKQRDAAFYHFLQPHILSRPLTDEEFANLTTPEAAMYLHLPRAESIANVWSIIQDEAFKAIPDTVDLTHILDSIRQTKPTYFECCHVNRTGAHLIAEAIAAFIVGF